MVSDGPEKRQKGPSGLYVKSISGEFVELAAANDTVCDDLRAELLKVAAINRDSGRRMVVSFEEEAPVEPRRIVNLSAGCAVLRDARLARLAAASTLVRPEPHPNR